MGISPIHWVSFLGCHWHLRCQIVKTVMSGKGKCNLAKGVRKQPLLLFSFLYTKRKEASATAISTACRSVYGRVLIILDTFLLIESINSFTVKTLLVLKIRPVTVTWWAQILDLNLRRRQV